MTMIAAEKVISTKERTLVNFDYGIFAPARRIFMFQQSLSKGMRYESHAWASAGKLWVRCGAICSRSSPSPFWLETTNESTR